MPSLAMGPGKCTVTSMGSMTRYEEGSTVLFLLLGVVWVMRDSRKSCCHTLRDSHSLPSNFTSFISLSSRLDFPGDIRNVSWVVLAAAAAAAAPIAREFVAMCVYVFV